MPSPATPAASSSSTPAASTRTSLRTMAPIGGSRTLVLVQPEHNGGERGNHSDELPAPSGSLRLRGGPQSRPRVVWDANVVDNEHMGKKKSKICCIYHKPKAFDESSDESSDSDSDTDSAPSDDGRARPSQRSPRRRCSHDNHVHQDTSSLSGTHRSTDTTDINMTHQHQHCHHHHHHSDDNAYESQPFIKGKGRANGN